MTNAFLPTYPHPRAWAGALTAALLMAGHPAHADEDRDTSQAMACETVVINEFASAKQRQIDDEDGNYPDWIELYNCSDEPVSLKDWALSDRGDDPQQWTFPDVQLAPGAYQLVWASGKDRRDPQKPLHTNFKIASTGEPLLLTRPDGQRADTIAPLAMPKHESIGRHPDGAQALHRFDAPTPGQPNQHPTNAIVHVAPPTFSHESGFYPKAFDLTLSHPDPDVTIYYTLDGSDPDPDNLEGKTFRYKNEYAQPPATEPTGEFLYQEYKTHVYQKPIRIVDRTWEPDRMSQISTTFDAKPDYFPQPELIKEERRSVKQYAIDQTNRMIKEINRAVRSTNRLANRGVRKFHKIRTGEVRALGDIDFIPHVPKVPRKGKYKHLYKGTPIKAIAVDHDHNQSSIRSGVLFIGDKNQFGLPVININVPEKDLFDYDEGIFVAGVDYDTFLLDGKDVTGAKHHRPANWKRPKEDINSSLSVFDEDRHVNSDLSIRIHGNATRANRNKSIRLLP